MATGLCPAAPCCCTMLCAYAHAHTDDTPVHLERALWLLRMSWTPGPCTAVCFVPDSLSPECCDPATARASTPHEPQFLTQPHLVGTPGTDARAPAQKKTDRTRGPRLNRSRAHENALGVDPAPLELSRGPHPPREELLACPLMAKVSFSTLSPPTGHTRTEDWCQPLARVGAQTA